MPYSYPNDFRDNVVLQFLTVRNDHPTKSAAIRWTAAEARISPETLRRWIRAAERPSADHRGSGAIGTIVVRKLKKEAEKRKQDSETLAAAARLLTAR